MSSAPCARPASTRKRCATWRARSTCPTGTNRRCPASPRASPTEPEQRAPLAATLRERGFRQVRVRHHGDLARVEVAPEEMERLLEPTLRTELAEHLRTLGFRYVTVDLIGYRTGSLNEGLGLKPAPKA